MAFSRAACAMAALSLGIASIGSAHAGVVTFEDVTPGFLTPSISSGGMSLTSAGTGFSGVDSAVAFSIFGNAPSGSTGQFLYALNNDAVMLSAGGSSFRLLGFSAAFIAPFAQAPGTVAGLLRVATLTLAGLVESEYDFGAAGADGNWNFFSVGSLALAPATAVSFSACVYDGTGRCVRDQSLSQFALDNIQVPEPGSVALVLGALGVLAATRRRQSV